MEKVRYKNHKKKNKMGSLLEGYLYGLGEVCNVLFGPRGEVAMFKAIGSYFLQYLEQKMGVTFEESDPWERYCHIIEVFTQYGFYSYVEMKKQSENNYWMLESDQYAGSIWEEQGSWERGTPPCPLWSVVLYSLSQINYTIILDRVTFDKDARGYESTFHFEKINSSGDGVIENARKEIRSSLLPICSNCKNIRDDKGNWIKIEKYFTDRYEMNFTHSVCPDCAKKLYNYSK